MAASDTSSTAVGASLDEETPNAVNEDDADVDRAPICPYCGVTALAGEIATVLDTTFVCENPDCEAFGDVIESPG